MKRNESNIEHASSNAEKSIQQKHSHESVIDAANEWLNRPLNNNRLAHGKMTYAQIKSEPVLIRGNWYKVYQGSLYFEKPEPGEKGNYYYRKEDLF